MENSGNKRNDIFTAITLSSYSNFSYLLYRFANFCTFFSSFQHCITSLVVITPPLQHSGGLYNTISASTGTLATSIETLTASGKLSWRLQTLSLPALSRFYKNDISAYKQSQDFYNNFDASLGALKTSIGTLLRPPLALLLPLLTLSWPLLNSQGLSWYS
jgi:hypothetical protein